MSVEEIVKAVTLSFAPIVVVTGGEPAVHDLEFLVNSLHALASVRVHLETSGGFRIKGDFDWITLSPKKWGPPLRENVIAASEFKIIVEEKDDIKFYLNMLTTRGMMPVTSTQPIWLHPEWGHREDPVVLGAISDAVKQGRGILRAGWQLHKLYQVDRRDVRTMPMVPLGGDLRKGY
jgi:organic radical activating enzyme